MINTEVAYPFTISFVISNQCKCFSLCFVLQLTIVLLLSCAVVSTNLCFLPSFRRSFPCCSGCLSLCQESLDRARAALRAARQLYRQRFLTPEASEAPPAESNPASPTNPTNPTNSCMPSSQDFTGGATSHSIYAQPPQSTHWLHRLLVYFHTVAPFPFAEHSFWEIWVFLQNEKVNSYTN